MGIELELGVLLALQTLGTSIFARFEVETPVLRIIIKWGIVILGTLGLSTWQLRDPRTQPRRAAPQQYDQMILQNQEAQRDGGHWGVPLMVFEGEPFFGQDRFDLLKWRLEQHGLTHRR